MNNIEMNCLPSVEISVRKHQIETSNVK